MDKQINDEIPEDKILSEYKTDYSFSYKESNTFSIILFIFSFVFFIGIFGLIWGFKYTWIISEKFIFNAYITIPVIICGIFIHELLHALTLLIFGNIKISNLKAGINWINFTPYVHCKHPISVSIYRKSTFAPALLIGIIPTLIAVFLGNVQLLFFGILFIVTAGSDLFSLWKLRKVKGNFLASDHPDKAGCFVFENPFL
jgi:hypothetical protein